VPNHTLPHKPNTTEAASNKGLLRSTTWVVGVGRMLLHVQDVLQSSGRSSRKAKRFDQGGLGLVSRGTFFTEPPPGSVAPVTRPMKAAGTRVSLEANSSDLFENGRGTGKILPFSKRRNGQAGSRTRRVRVPARKDFFC
jgi:hypothetical protein